jgi:hypothetical protein
MNTKKPSIHRRFALILLISIITLFTLTVNYLASAIPIVDPILGPGVTLTGIGAGSIITGGTFAPSYVGIVDQYVELDYLTATLPHLYFSPAFGNIIILTSAAGFTIIYTTAAPTLLTIYTLDFGAPVVSGATSLYNPIGSYVDITSLAGATVTVCYTPIPAPGYSDPSLVNSTTISGYLAAGDYIGLALSPYSLLLGDMLGGLLMFAIMMPLYNRTQSLDYCLVVWCMLSAALTVALPLSTFRLSYIFLILGVAVLLYKLMIPRG